MSYSKGLPKNEIVVVVVDNGGDTTIGIEPQEFRALVFLRNEIEVHRLVRQLEFFENDSDFPESGIEFQNISEKQGRAYQPLGAAL